MTQTWKSTRFPLSCQPQHKVFARESNQHGKSGNCTGRIRMTRSFSPLVVLVREHTTDSLSVRLVGLQQKKRRVHVHGDYVQFRALGGDAEDFSNARVRATLVAADEFLDV